MLGKVVESAASGPTRSLSDFGFTAFLPIEQARIDRAPQRLGELRQREEVREGKLVAVRVQREQTICFQRRVRTHDEIDQQAFRRASLDLRRR